MSSIRAIRRNAYRVKYGPRFGDVWREHVHQAKQTKKAVVLAKLEQQLAAIPTKKRKGVLAWLVARLTKAIAKLRDQLGLDNTPAELSLAGAR